MLRCGLCRGGQERGGVLYDAGGAGGEHVSGQLLSPGQGHVLRSIAITPNSPLSLLSCISSDSLAHGSLTRRPHDHRRCDDRDVDGGVAMMMCQVAMLRIRLSLAGNNTPLQNRTSAPLPPPPPIDSSFILLAGSTFRHSTSVAS
eukprot:577503-Rhodomonas_salina.1